MPTEMVDFIASETKQEKKNKKWYQKSDIDETMKQRKKNKISNFITDYDKSNCREVKRKMPWSNILSCIYICI